MEKIILIGGGGHCRSCIDVLEKEQKYSIAGIVDVKDKIGQKVYKYSVIASDDDLPGLVKRYKNCLVTLGSIEDASKRKKLFEQLSALGAKTPVIISPFARVSSYAEIARGTIVMHGVSINAGARIGENCIINTGAIIEHDALIGHHSHISTGAVVNGECAVGPESFVGSNSVIINNISLVSKTVIGSGSVVIRSITDPGTYAGNPAGKITK